LTGNRKKKIRWEKAFEAAIDNYEKILALDSKVLEDRDELVKTNKELEGFEKKKAYIDKIDLFGWQAKYYETDLEDRVPRVPFRLKNNEDSPNYS